MTSLIGSEQLIMDIVWSKQTLELGLFTKDRQQMPIIEGEKLLHLLANLMFFFFF